MRCFEGELGSRVPPFRWHYLNPCARNGGWFLSNHNPFGLVLKQPFVSVCATDRFPVRILPHCLNELPESRLSLVLMSHYP